MKRLFLLTLLSLFFLFPTQVFAQENWVIDEFDSDIVVQEDGRVSVIENIKVDFGPLQKHGIFRDIPYIYTSNSGEKTYTSIEIVSVTDDGSRVHYETSTTGGYVRIKIGDPDKTIYGEQTYRIEYIATGVLRPFENHDELFWNVTGGGWPVPISKVGATVVLPKDGITETICFQGSVGSTNQCTSSQMNKKKAAFFSKGSLATNEGLTIVVGYTKGLAPIIKVPPPKNPFADLFTIQSLAIFIVTLLVGVGLVFLLWFVKGRDYWWRKRFIDDPEAKHEVRPVGAHEPIVVEYSPPEKLRPAEVGTLIDEKANTTDVTATIIDLATREFLKIKEIEKKWVFGSTDYEFTKASKDTSSLVNYEKELFDRVFDEGDTVKMSDLKKEFYKDLKKVKEELYKEMVNKKFFYENPESVRKKYLIVGVVILFLGGGLVFLGFATLVMILSAFGAAVSIAGATLLILSNFMPRKTAYGRDIYRRVKGYELFVTKAEKYRQKFFEKKNMFNEVLPYAIVFGVTEKFAKAFKDMGIEPQQPGWYIGSRPFNAVVFGASMSSFSNSLSSAMATTPGGSGFSSGGGFSGGGFGGGGGGSW